MADAPKPPEDDAGDKSLYGDHASGRYGDQAYGRVEPPVPAGKAAHDGTNAQVVSGAPAVPTSGTDDELSSPGISTDKKADDTKPALGA